MEHTNTQENIKQLQRTTYLKTMIAVILSGIIAYLSSTLPVFINMWKSVLSTNVGAFSIVIFFILALSFFNKQINDQNNNKIILGYFIASILLMGFFYSTIFLVYPITHILSVFLMTSIYFVVLIGFSFVSTIDFTKYTSILTISLVTLILISLISIFLAIPLLNTIISVVAVIIFSFYTMKDNQELVKVGSEISSNQIAKYSTIFALMLFVDFINLFVNLLNILKRN